MYDHLFLILPLPLSLYFSRKTLVKVLEAEAA